MMAAMADYGGNFFNQEVARLMGLSGANANPATGAALEMQGIDGANSMAMQGLNRVGYGLTQQKNPMTDILMRMMLNRGGA